MQIEDSLEKSTRFFLFVVDIERKRDSVVKKQNKWTNIKQIEIYRHSNCKIFSVSILVSVLFHFRLSHLSLFP